MKVVLVEREWEIPEEFKEKAKAINKHVVDLSLLEGKRTMDEIERGAVAWRDFRNEFYLNLFDKVGVCSKDYSAWSISVDATKLVGSRYEFEEDIIVR
jgi:hypothetical protein